ncbi:ABC transporter substrate-binding protein [Paracoccus onubensis]|uniref:ABC transporter substrate-binding protein n=1 Tax=Paracoccus onubensis TaxID=1675788 RepID=UPI0027303747|nr:ABC transporter substrate-binding protein [Paracoccus onubensis]MDP0926157.1 ABC transporter substrate-binding protein [Paracoccus onubensis]
MSRLNPKRMLLGAVFAALMTGGALAQDRELVIAQGIDTPGFDIHNHSTSAVEAIHVNIFDYLVMRDQAGELQPALATDWEQVSDSAMRFHLREGVLFHDGTTMTAEDVKFSLERPALDPAVLQHSFYDTITEVEVVNDHEIIIHTDGPDPILLNRISRIGSGIVPKAYVDEVGWEGFSQKPIGTGPFKVVEWLRDDRIIMEGFDEHWRGAPAWDRLIHRTIPEASTRVGELISGGVDIATNIPSQDRDRVEGSGIAHAVPWPSFRVMQLFLNTKDDSPLADPKVREAIDLAIDNQMLIDTVTNGLGTPVRAAVTPGLSAVPMAYYDTYNFDPERAVQLLEEAGYGPNELQLKLQGPAGRYPLDVETLEIVAVMLNAVGIQTDIETLEWSAYESRVWTPNTIDGIALIGHANSLQDGYHAVQRARCGFEFSLKTGWCDEEFDKLIEQSAATVDPKERAQQISDAFDLFVESNTVLHLFQVENLIGVSTSVDWSPSPDEQLWMYDAQPQ